MSELEPTSTELEPTATERLRALLDERGVEYRWDNGTATWYVDGVMYNAWGRDNERLTMSVCHLTPEQAIAATLGQEDIYTREDMEGAFVSGYSLGSLPVGSDPRWNENRQTVDEHMAELGWVRKEAATLGSFNCSSSERTETCHPVISDNLMESEGTGDAWADCSECGHLLFVLTDPNSQVPNFCPNCGKRIEVDDG